MMRRRVAQPTQTNPRSVRGAFSLIELIVAVGAFAIVAIAVATIFGSVGDTISAGQRQSRLNQVTAQIERVMRRDFDQMSRDGFLVIRNEWAIALDGPQPDNDGDGYTDRLNVPLFAGDTSPRPRRVDQIMFFTRGQYESARSPVQPGMVATANEARVWYGHGQRKYDGDDPAYPDTYLDPRLDDTMQGYDLPVPAVDRLGYDPGPANRDIINPNRYAADWSLLRHVTLLVPPVDPMAQALPDFGSDGLYGYPVDRANDASGFRTGVSDGEFQIGLQPAVSGIFWSTQQLDPQWSSGSDPNIFGYVRDYDPDPFTGNPAFGGTGYPRVVDIAYDDVTTGLHPVTPGGLPEVAAARTSSGLIDIATTSLAEIEAVVTASDFNVYGNTTTLSGNGIVDFRDFDHMIKQNRGSPAQPLYFPNTLGQDNKPWKLMVDALPVPPDSMATVSSMAGPLSDEEILPTFIAGGADAHRNRTSPRIRYEPSPPNPSAGPDSLDPQERIRGIYAQADQEILTRWAFVPRCTEFIVEWTYGWVFDDNQPTGSPYYATITDPRYKQLVWFGRDRYTMDTNGDGRIVEGDDRPTVLFYQQKVPMLSLSAEDPARGMIVGQGLTDQSTPRLAELETAAFGYVRPATPTQAQPVPGGGAPTLNAWPWPTQIRITMSFADPGDPSVESTIEAVFDVPAADGGGA
ncbi:MAG: hypothetical protein DHS20C14_07000 [Phycisphaeraceae bacterium]|nr:MAG: hypothetical protein DHS20C14_07000 [Phycisphaeraceae bacterium]